MRRQQDRHSRVFDDLSSLVLNILRCPPSDLSSSTRRPQITPAGFASFFLGISLSLMLCGSLTFFIGFLLFPWVLACFMLFYFLGFVSTLSVLARAFFSYLIFPPPSSTNDISAWKYL